MYRVIIIVEGRGLFPLDMLRYDACFPSDFKAVAGIGSPACGPGRHEREVKLCQPRQTATERQVTVDRWKSFGWVVKSIQVFDKRNKLLKGKV